MPLHVDYSHEDSVIGQIIMAADSGQGDIVRSAMAEVEPEDFTRHRKAFEAMRKVMSDGELPDSVQLGRQLGQCKELVEAMDATSPVFSVTNVRIMARQLHGQRKQAEFGQAQERAMRTQAKDDFAKAAKLAQEIASGGSESGKVFSMRQVAREVFSHMEQAYSGTLPEHPQTGYPDLDDCLGGLQPGGVTIIAARPGVGKTAFALNIVERACLLKGEPSLFVSCEMTKGELFTRLLAQRTKISLQTLRTGSMKDHDWPKLSEATTALDKAPLTIWDGTAPNLNDITKALDACPGAKLLFVDYIQLCSAISRRDRRDLEIQEVSQGLKAIAKERKLHVVALSQLNRENDSDKPRLSGLRGSGSIEQDADAVLLLSKADDDGYGETSVACDVAKNRHGPLRRVALRWMGGSMRFESVAA